MIEEKYEAFPIAKSSEKHYDQSYIFSKAGTRKEPTLNKRGGVNSSETKHCLCVFKRCVEVMPCFSEGGGDLGSGLTSGHHHLPA